jgi:hypothetical protein
MKLDPEEEVIAAALSDGAERWDGDRGPDGRTPPGHIDPHQMRAWMVYYRATG